MMSRHVVGIVHVGFSSLEDVIFVAARSRAKVDRPQ